jgi:hypothetical protein
MRDTSLLLFCDEWCFSSAPEHLVLYIAAQDEAVTVMRDNMLGVIQVWKQCLGACDVEVACLHATEAPAQRCPQFKQHL